ncbi:MAG: 30S ribosomal protein S1, partial [Persephonella sp.]
MENLETSFEELLEEYEKSFEPKQYSKGEIIKGKIVKFVNDNLVYVDIGMKTEAVIPKEEVEGLNEGDEIEAIFTRKKLDDYWRITRKPLVIKQAREEIKNAFENKKTIKAKLLEKKKKGYLIQINGFKAYMPNSETGLKGGEELPEEFNVIILSLDESNNRLKIITSRKKALEIEKKERKQQVLNSLEKGKVIKGKVVKILDKGALILIDNVLTGFLPNSLYSWDKDKTTKELKEGEEIEVLVKDLDKEKEKVILSKKDLEPNPWDVLDKNVGDTVDVEIVNINDKGLIVKLNGVKGFIHKSETDHINTEAYRDRYKVRDKVKAKIINLDKKNRRLKLSIKALTSHPVDKFLEKNPVGSSVKGKIKEIKNKMAIIELNKDLEGVLYLEDATWNPKIRNISQVLKGKKELEFMVLDRKGNRIKLGLKQFRPNPWETFRKQYKKGDIVKVKVKKLIDRGAFVDIIEDVEGFIPLREITKEEIKIPSDKLKLNQEVEAKIIRMKDKD